MFWQTSENYHAWIRKSFFNTVNGLKFILQVTIVASADSSPCLKTLKASRLSQKNFAYAFAENNLAGNPTVIFITFPVPRHLQLTETHQCWVKCAIGMKYDENEGGETFQVLRILGFFCNCTLMLSSDCSHGVRKPIYF